MPLKTPLKIFGGKRYLSSWLASIAAPVQYLHRVHLCAGGLGELTNWPTAGKSIVINDVDGYLISFYRVLQREDLFLQFQRVVSAVLFSRQEWDDVDALMRAAQAAVPGEVYHPEVPSVSVAVAFFVWNRQSMGGRCEDFTPLTKKRLRGNRNAEVNAWWSAVAGLPEFRQVVDSFVVEHDDWLVVAKREDGPTTLQYADPTYLKITRSGPADVYQHEMTVAQHEEFLKFVSGPVEGKFMISGYRSDLYDSYLKGWTRHELEIDNKAAKGPTKRKMVECCYTNF